MFSKTDGPTALHADLVRTLSFAKAQVDLDSADGLEPAIAALASVWNGKKGFIALIIRYLGRQRVERWVYNQPITTESLFKTATDEGLTFAESLGFQMDPPEFAELSAELKVRRLKHWNKLRKVRMPRAATAPPASSGAPVKAVLGRIALERRRSGGRWPNPIERLLAFF